MTSQDFNCISSSGGGALDVNYSILMLLNPSLLRPTAEQYSVKNVTP